MLERLYPADDSVVPIERGEGGEAFDLREALSFVWRQWKFIASVVGVILVIAVVYLVKQTPLYTATALILLDPQKQKPAGAESFVSDVSLDFAAIENQMAIIRSSVFLQRVVVKERLVSDPEFGSNLPQTSQDGQPIAPDVLASAVSNSVGALMGATFVKRAGQGHLLSVSVTSVDPARAARLANAVADAYVVEKLDARFDAAKRASSWLSDRLVDLRKQLRESEEAVAQFRAEHGFLQSSTNVTLTQQQLSELSAKVMEARADVAQKKARVDILRSIEEKGGSIQNLPDLPNSQQLGSLRTQEQTSSQKVAELATRYSDRHPLVVNARAELRDIQRGIQVELQRLAANVRNEYDLATARAEAVERSLREATGQTNTDDRAAITLRELERTAAVNKSLFEDFLQKSKITDEQATFEARDARVIAPAAAPGAPSSPQKFRTMIIALAIGLVVGVGGALAKEKLNTGFTTPWQIEERLRLPLLASVNSMSSAETTVEGKAVKIPLYAAAAPLSRFNEAMRALRSGIQMTDVDRPPKVIQLTSTIPGEGKTTIALSLATSAAGAGLKVLYIDADLRHPSGSHFFGLHKDPGLVDLLMHNIEPQDLIKYSESGKLWVLAAGGKTNNPTDLLGSDRMKFFLDRFKRTFDFVVVDTPPLGPVTDPLIVAQMVDKVVYVVRWASTPRELVESSIKHIHGLKKVAGVVFNHVNPDLAQKYGKHAFSYYYGARDYRKYYSGKS